MNLRLWKSVAIIVAVLLECGRAAQLLQAG